MNLAFKIGATILGFGFVVLLVFVVATFFLQPGNPFFMTTYSVMVFLMVLGICLMILGGLIGLWKDKD